ncbi:MAG: FecR domain-containing protein [Bacteroidota bacterium]
MNEQEFNKLLEKYRDGNCSAEEKVQLDSWLTFGHFSAGTYSDQQVDDRLSRLAKRLPLFRKRISLWPRIGIAAAIATMVFGAGLFYYRLNQDQSNVTAYKNDVAPGKMGATLTLASGKKIRLTDVVNGELAKEAGVTITKSADGKLVYAMGTDAEQPDKINTLSTANGETYELRLPDGSSVWLNSASTLTYNASLNENGKRTVKLSGEAYFQVAKDKQHPFIVQTGNQQVEVLGTHFNVNSYSDEPFVATTLEEGSVKVSSGAMVKMLKPGQQSLNNGTEISVAEADLENITDWKNGDFFLDGVDFKVAMRKIARWYDVEVIYDGSVSDNIKSGGWVSRKNPLSAVLKSIESSGLVHFRIDGRKIYVSK